MTAEVVTVGPDTSATHAGELMAEPGVVAVHVLLAVPQGAAGARS